MTNSQKRIGDLTEREFCALAYDLLGVNIERKLGAGRKEDTGDIWGLDGWTIQVTRATNVGTILVPKTRDGEIQQHRAGTTFGATAIRIRGGPWIITQTPEQWATVVREVKQ